MLKRSPEKMWYVFHITSRMKQNYANHKKYYAPHHFILLPLLGVLLTYGITQIFSDTSNILVWKLFSIVVFCILYLAIMLRQHYALGNQDRIIRLEFRLRYFELYSQSALETERQLNFDQIAALRFANDKEFKNLLDKALINKLPGNSIKRDIREWVADDMRL